MLLTVRNWDLERVRMCLASLEAQVDVDYEIVVVDYGSDDAEPLRSVVSEFDAKLIRIEAEVWSRSKAMNVAASAATAPYYIFADADLVFEPRVLAATYHKLVENKRTVLMFSFRDLPQGVEPVSLQSDVDFDQLDEMASWRPRWGMGVQAYSAHAFWEIRGFDNRMKIYGGEDNDIAKRVRAHGYRLTWVNGRDFGLYHVWHPSSREAADLDPEQKKELSKNSDIAKNDKSVVRNLDWQSEGTPLVSVVITTFNRADFIRDSIESVLTQTVQDFEVLVLDDGSTDDTQSVVESISDERVRYFKMPKTGIPGLRNFALSETRGKYTAIHDDDDIMLPWSLESRLSAIQSGFVGSYGGAYNFSNATGELQQFPGRDYSLHAILNGGKVFLHATLLIETAALSAIGYDENFQSGSDFNLALRIAKTGMQLRHCGDFVLLRRLHDRQVTLNDKAVQHNASYCSSFAQRIAWGEGERFRSREASKLITEHVYSDEMKESARVFKYLPPHLVRRGYLVASPSNQEKQLARTVQVELVAPSGECKQFIFTDSLEGLDFSIKDRIDTLAIPKNDAVPVSDFLLQCLPQIATGTNYVFDNLGAGKNLYRVYLDTVFDPELCGKEYCSVFTGDSSIELMEILEKGVH